MNQLFLGGIITILAAILSANGEDMVERKIAIVGGGIGGTSCSYFLRQLLGPRAKIDLFEKSSILGGRLATINMSDQRYESGGSIIHERNRYMQDFVKMFGLKKRDYSTSTDDDILGLYNGHRYVFRASSWSLWTMLKLIWRYGLSLLRLDWTIGSMLDKFDRIYKNQENGHSYETVEKLLESMDPGFVENVQRSFKDYLKKEKFSELFANELADAAVRVNYGQNLNVTGFVGTVALAGAQKGLWSVQGGNRLVAEKLFENSSAELRRCEVTKIIKNSDKLFNINCLSDETLYENYDIVILALPFIEGLVSIDFENFSIPPISYGPYHRLFATFVHGRLNENVFCHEKKSSIFSDPCPSEILVCSDDSSWFNSVGALKSVDSGKSDKDGRKKDENRVWKIFSSNRLPSDQINRLFDRIIDSDVVEWMAYPKYNGGLDKIWERIRDAKFELSDGLFHVNAIEWAASAMEMSVIGARNVALLVKERLGMEVDKKLYDELNEKVEL